MSETEKLLKPILKSLCGIAVCLAGVVFAAHQIYFLSIPLVLIGILVCLHAYDKAVPTETELAKRTQESLSDDAPEKDSEEKL